MASKGATLELAVLGLLHDSPLHGYELRKRLNLLLGWTRLLSYGSLYPALKRMLRAGLVTEVATAPLGVSRRQRIVYQITPAGTEYFAGRITDVGPSAWEDEDFNMRFAFFSRTDSEVRLRILEGRRSRLQERLDRARSSRGPAGADRYVTRAPAPRHRVRRAGGALADRPDRGRAFRAGAGATVGSTSGTPHCTTQGTTTSHAEVSHSRGRRTPVRRDPVTNNTVTTNTVTTNAVTTNHQHQS